jgi:hypothetical protein
VPSQGSCWSVKKLPHVLEYGEVQKMRHVNTTNNILQKPPRIYKAVVTKKHFWNIPYVPTTYEKHQVLEKAAFEVDRNQIESTGRKAGLIIPSRIRAKYEDIFEDINYQYPTSVLGPAVGQSRLETIVRDDFSDMQRFTCGTTNRNMSHRKVPEKELGVEWTNKIFAVLVKDWPNFKFTVKFTKSDELLVQFEVDVTADGVPRIGNAMLHSLGKYMTTLVLRGVGSDLGLKKRGDRWGQLESCADEQILPGGKNGSPSKLPAQYTDTSRLPSDAGDVSQDGDNENNSTDTKRLLTYSMYAPWVSVGLMNATRAAAFASRQHAHEKILAEKDLERQERLQRLALLKGSEDDSANPKPKKKLVHAAIHGLSKSAKYLPSRNKSPSSGRKSPS